MINSQYLQKMVEFMLETDHPSGTNIGSSCDNPFVYKYGRTNGYLSRQTIVAVLCDDDLPWIIRNQSVSAGERRTVHEIETAFNSKRQITYGRQDHCLSNLSFKV